MSSLTSSMGDQSNSHQEKPIQIIKVKDGRVELDIGELSSVLLKPSVKDKPVVVISVAGDFRKGKSFLLNFFLRYLKSPGSANWIGNQSSELTGFHWCNGTEGDTEGILIWPQIFEVSLLNPSGGITEVAIVLMDTQGVFSRGLSLKESVAVFALSTLLSSVQIFNLKNNIQENDLQSLEIFTEYGRLMLEVDYEKPFQRLMFLIRDWESPDECSYGLEGGQTFLDKCLVIDETNNNESQRVRESIRDCFSTTECFLMPHPGMAVTKKQFKGRIAEIDHEFVYYLKIFVEHIFKPENLSVKKIGGNIVKGKELMEFFQQYTSVLESKDKIPEPKTIFTATAEANNLIALNKAKDLYQSSMEKVCDTKNFIKKEILFQYHKQYSDSALNQFDSAPKIGGINFSRKYRDKLVVAMEATYISYERQNYLKKSILLKLWKMTSSDLGRSITMILLSTLGILLNALVPGMGELGTCMFAIGSTGSLVNVVFIVIKNFYKNIVTHAREIIRTLHAAIDWFILIRDFCIFIAPFLLIIVKLSLLWYFLQLAYGIVEMFYTALMH